jgi:hypothetical protein
MDKKRANAVFAANELRTLIDNTAAETDMRLRADVAAAYDEADMNVQDTVDAIGDAVTSVTSVLESARSTKVEKADAEIAAKGLVDLIDNTAAETEMNLRANVAAACDEADMSVQDIVNVTGDAVNSVTAALGRKQQAKAKTKKGPSLK